MTACPTHATLALSVNATPVEVKAYISSKFGLNLATLTSTTIAKDTNLGVLTMRIQNSGTETLQTEDMFIGLIKVSGNLAVYANGTTAAYVLPMPGPQPRRLYLYLLVDRTPK